MGPIVILLLQIFLDSDSERILKIRHTKMVPFLAHPVDEFNTEFLVRGLKLCPHVFNFAIVPYCNLCSLSDVILIRTYCVSP